MAHFELVEQMAPNAIIKVIGVGGGGGNAVAHMVSGNVDGVEFITANTDSQAIKNCGAKLQLQLGSNVTKGLGAGANPEVGRQAALVSADAWQGRALLKTHVRQCRADLAHRAARHVQSIDRTSVIAWQRQMHRGQCGHRAAGAEQADVGRCLGQRLGEA